MSHFWSQKCANYIDPYNRFCKVCKHWNFVKFKKNHQNKFTNLKQPMDKYHFWAIFWFKMTCCAIETMPPPPKQCQNCHFIGVEQQCYYLHRRWKVIKMTNLAFYEGKTLTVLDQIATQMHCWKKIYKSIKIGAHG